MIGRMTKEVIDPFAGANRLQEDPPVVADVVVGFFDVVVEFDLGYFGFHNSLYYSRPYDPIGIDDMGYLTTQYSV